MINSIDQHILKDRPASMQFLSVDKVKAKLKTQKGYVKEALVKINYFVVKMRNETVSKKIFYYYYRLS